MKQDVIIQWDHGHFPAELLPKLVRPYKVVTLQKEGGGQFGGFKESVTKQGPRPIRKYIHEKLGIDPLRICVVGFSASCAGVWAFLNSQDAGFIDTAVAIDGIHGGLDAWTEFARIAAFGIPPGSPWPPGPRRCIITHSSVKPPYRSTTESAAAIIGALYSQSGLPQTEIRPDLWEPALPFTCRNPLGKKITYTTAPSKYSVVQNGLYILGYNNIDPSGGHCDHIYQAKRVMPLVLDKLLVERWNTEDPSAGTCFTV